MDSPKIFSRSSKIPKFLTLRYGSELFLGISMETSSINIYLEQFYTNRSSRYCSVNDDRTFSFWDKMYYNFFSMSAELRVLYLYFCLIARLLLSFCSRTLLCMRVQRQWGYWPDCTRIELSFLSQLWWVINLSIYSFYCEVRWSSFIVFNNFISLSVYSSKISSGWIRTLFYFCFFFGLFKLLF